MENSTDGFFGDIVNTLLRLAEEKLNSQFEQDCLKHYLDNTGTTMELSKDTFQLIAAETLKLQEAAGGRLAGTTSVNINGKRYYTKCINFYGCRDFDYALGCSTLYFDEEGTPVGIYDRYDFDAAKHRDTLAEQLTELMSFLASKGIGKAYDIVYGVK
ncbi:MAG: hypothetical protein LBM61_06115 [Prevotellaceae bacterium]|jgi:hypothetical protein|nr:hypothetical protein [Prevotellaceae bacterium]